MSGFTVLGKRAGARAGFEQMVETAVGRKRGIEPTCECAPPTLLIDFADLEVSVALQR